ncbi:MAG: hypothetical protein INR73_11175 [Williamsia sp.]|nr:hypothetical protein [Williamsia sp.]
MKEKQFSKELSSYVSFALKSNSATLSAQFVDSTGNITSNPAGQPEIPGRLSDNEFRTIEALLERYAPVKAYLPGATTINTLEGVDPDYKADAVYQKPGFRYKAVAVNKNQLEIARYVSKKVDDIYSLCMMGERGLAKASYDALQDFLANTKAALISEYKSVADLEESVGMHAVGTNGNPQALRNPVIFILIEIFIG